MADEQAFDFEDEDSGEGGARSKRPRKLVVAVIVVSSLLGAVVGGGVVAPRVAVGSAAEAHKNQNQSEGGHGGGGHGQEGGGNIVEFENVIVNPAGSDGLRFLMATVAFDVSSSEEQDFLRERKLQIRDRVTSVLEAQTIEMLTAHGARDSLKVLLRHVLVGFVDEAAPVRVYIPHFVIQ